MLQKLFFQAVVFRFCLSNRWIDVYSTQIVVLTVDNSANNIIIKDRLSFISFF